MSDVLRTDERKKYYYKYMHASRRMDNLLERKKIYDEMASRYRQNKVKKEIIEVRKKMLEYRDKVEELQPDSARKCLVEDIDADLQERGLR